MKQQGHTNTELPDWLEQNRIITSSAILERRLRKWGVRKSRDSNRRPAGRAR
jgi:hypothetical protein